MEEAYRGAVIDGAWYARRADALGWGPRTAAVDPERERLLRRWVQGTVLDVGCATGVYVDLLAKAGHEVRGIDLSDELVSYARTHRRGHFDVGDAEALPYGDDAFDTVLAFDVLEHVDDARALAEIARVARRRVLIAVPARTPSELLDAGLLLRHHEDPSHRRAYARADVERLVLRAGLRLESLEPAGYVDLGGLLLATIRHPKPWAERLAHRLVFKVLRHVPPRRYPSAWQAAAAVAAAATGRVGSAGSTTT